MPYADLTLVDQPSSVAQWLEHPPRKWKVLGLSPGWVNTFQKVWHGLIGMRHPGTMHSVKGGYDPVSLCSNCERDGIYAVMTTNRPVVLFAILNIQTIHPVH